MTLLYDGTYEGLMTVIFDCYERKLNPDFITSSCLQPGMFDNTQNIITDVKKAERVLKGLRKKLTPKGFNRLYLAFHSELQDIEMTIYQFTKITIANKINIERDFRQASVLRISQATKMMGREIHRMHAFVRFQKTSDDIYAATITPDFNVIPFIGDHFKKRYADQQWLIYDTQRDYGLYYDLETMQLIKLSN
ncbi:MAG: TIGR03915 family putative DNA repair protein, partial [Bacteroidota bacterium]